MNNGDQNNGGFESGYVLTIEDRNIISHLQYAMRALHRLTRREDERTVLDFAIRLLERKKQGKTVEGFVSASVGHSVNDESYFLELSVNASEIVLGDWHSVFSEENDGEHSAIEWTRLDMTRGFEESVASEWLERLTDLACGINSRLFLGSSLGGH